MYYTEAEANRKWCVGGPWAGANWGSNPTRRTCEGSRCVAWRWEGRDDGVAIATGRGHIPKEKARGYCGLAVHPNV